MMPWTVVAEGLKGETRATHLRKRCKSTRESYKGPFWGLVTTRLFNFKLVSSKKNQIVNASILTLLPCSQQPKIEPLNVNNHGCPSPPL